MSRNDRKRNVGASVVGWLIWILAAVALVIVFLVNQKRIAGNLKSTGFFDKVFGKTPAFLEMVETPDTNSQKNDVQPFDQTVEIQLVPGHRYDDYEEDEQESSYYSYKPEVTDNKTDDVSNQKLDSGDKLTGNISDNGISEDVALGVYAENQGNGITMSEVPVTKVDKLNTAVPVNPNLIYEPNTTDPVKSPVEAPAETVSLRLFFIELNDDGTSNIKEVSRKMKKTSTPLTDAINALIDGPTKGEEKTYRCRTMVSPGTRLLSASVRNGVATLNFSEDFEFNNYGIEGVMWELDQIVYTATAFPTVEKVQFLIEGAHREYISEGLRIGEPLSRESL